MRLLEEVDLLRASPLRVACNGFFCRDQLGWWEVGVRMTQSELSFRLTVVRLLLGLNGHRRHDG